MIYVIEIPHQRDASCWSRIKAADIVSMIHEAHNRSGDIIPDDLDGALAFNRKDLSRQVVCMSDSEALALLDDGIAGHGSKRAMDSLRGQPPTTSADAVGGGL
jgi:hypothetical protein